jgi:plastocyanin
MFLPARLHERADSFRVENWKAETGVLAGVKALAGLSALCVAAAVFAVAHGARASGAAEPCQAGDIRVEITNFQYAPSSPTVLPGSTVCWTNNDVVAHTVTSGQAGGFDSGSIGFSESFRLAFPNEGTFQYICTIHFGMAGEVVVSSTAPPPPPPPPPGSPPPPPPGSPPAGSTARALAVSGFGVSVRRSGGARWVVARVTVNRAARARLALLRRGRTVAGVAKPLRRGRNVVRLRLAPGRHGRHVVRLTVGGTRRTASLQL